VWISDSAIVAVTICSVNPINNLNLVHSDSYTWQCILFKRRSSISYTIYVPNIYVSVFTLQQCRFFCCRAYGIVGCLPSHNSQLTASAFDWQLSNSFGRLIKLLLALVRIVNLSFGPRSDTRLYICLYHDFYLFRNGTFSSTRVGVWLLLVTFPLVGVTRTGTDSPTGPVLHTHTHKRLDSLSLFTALS
jgi:hypothetical protein